MAPTLDVHDPNDYDYDTQSCASETDNKATPNEVIDLADNADGATAETTTADAGSTSSDEKKRAKAKAKKHRNKENRKKRKDDDELLADFIELATVNPDAAKLQWKGLQRLQDCVSQMRVSMAELNGSVERLKTEILNKASPEPTGSLPNPPIYPPSPETPDDEDEQKLVFFFCTQWNAKKTEMDNELKTPKSAAAQAQLKTKINATTLAWGFLVDEDGDVVALATIEDVGSVIRSALIELEKWGKLGATWTDATGLFAKVWMVKLLEKTFPFLAKCHGHWKALYCTQKIAGDFLPRLRTRIADALTAALAAAGVNAPNVQVPANTTDAASAITTAIVKTPIVATPSAVAARGLPTPATASRSGATTPAVIGARSNAISGSATPAIAPSMSLPASDLKRKLSEASGDVSDTQSKLRGKITYDAEGNPRYRRRLTKRSKLAGDDDTPNSGTPQVTAPPTPSTMSRRPSTTWETPAGLAPNLPHASSSTSLSGAQPPLSLLQFETPMPLYHGQSNATFTTSSSTPSLFVAPSISQPLFVHDDQHDDTGGFDDFYASDPEDDSPPPQFFQNPAQVQAQAQFEQNMTASFSTSSSTTNSHPAPTGPTPPASSWNHPVPTGPTPPVSSWNHPAPTGPTPPTSSWNHPTPTGPTPPASSWNHPALTGPTPPASSWNQPAPTGPTPPASSWNQPAPPPAATGPTPPVTNWNQPAPPQPTRRRGRPAGSVNKENIGKACAYADYRKANSGGSEAAAQKAFNPIWKAMPLTQREGWNTFALKVQGGVQGDIAATSEAIVFDPPTASNSRAGPSNTQAGPSHGRQ